MLDRSSGNHDTQALAFLAVFVYATHATQAIAFEWKPGLSQQAAADKSYNENDTQLERCTTHAWATVVPIFMFLELFVLGVQASTCQTYHVT